jgi:hypothetical protein
MAKTDGYDFQEIGSSGLQRTAGFINDEFNVELQGIRGAKVYREMSDNDPVIGAMLYAIERLIIQIDWRVEPFKDDKDETTAKDEEVAAFVESCLYDMSESWESTLSNILTFLTYGYAYCEIVYKRRLGADQEDPTKRSQFSDGKIGWRKIALRAQETTWEWVLDAKGGIQGLRQLDPSVGPMVEIPIQKALLFRASSARNNPEGRSILRNAYRSWRFKKSIEEIEAIGMERDLAGMPVAYVPPSMLSSNATPAEVSARTAIEKLVRGIKRNENEGILFPLAYDSEGREMYKLTLLNAGGNRQFDTDKIISRYDQRIAMTVLADFILLGHENVGSFALGASKIDLFTTAIGQIAQSIAETFNQHALPRLLKMNGMDTARLPELTFGEITHVDLTLLADFIQKASAAGALVVDEGMDEYLRLVSGLPEREETGEEGVPQMPNNAAAQPAAPAPQPPQQQAAQGEQEAASEPEQAETEPEAE